MKALLYHRSVPRYLVLKAFGPRFRHLYTSPISPLALCDIPEPRLPTPQWVRIAPTLAGICGSDLGTFCAKGSPYLASLTSMPFVMGHEVVGRVVELGDQVRDLSVGDRVVLHPALGCKARGINPPCEACRKARDALCRNVCRGDISEGIQTGFCRDTGGGFGETFVAHRSQIYRVPVGVEDRVAVLIEPFACAIHGAMRVTLRPEDTALVIGCGSIGLLTIAALRATGCRARIVAVAKHEHQKAHALAMGADELLPAGGNYDVRYAAWAKSLDIEVFAAALGKPAVIGGAAATFDCVASSRTIDDALRLTRAGGTLVLVGMPGTPFGVDWTPMWFKELTVRAAYAYGPERYADGRRETFDIALDLVREWAPKLRGLVGEPHALADYRAAFTAAMRTGRSHVAKTVFAVNDGMRSVEC